MVKLTEMSLGELNNSRRSLKTTLYHFTDDVVVKEAIMKKLMEVESLLAKKKIEREILANEEKYLAISFLKENGYLNRKLDRKEQYELMIKIKCICTHVLVNRSGLAVWLNFLGVKYTYGEKEEGWSTVVLSLD